MSPKKVSGFIQLMIDAHGRGSGIEKGILNRFFPGPPKGNTVYLSTSLGYENAIELSEVGKVKTSLYSFLEAQLKYLKDKNVTLTRYEWIKFRQNFIHKINEYFSITVAETRRPLNDVTLLDQTAMSVAFFKAALAQNILLETWKNPYQQNAKVTDQYHWRLLRIGLDGLLFWSTSNRIGDILARKGCINATLNEIQDLLEVTYPLGTEIYRDENGSVFIVPDVENLLTYRDGTKTLEEQIQDISREIAKNKLSSESLFYLKPSEPTRETLTFGKLATESLPSPRPHPDWLKQLWQGQEQDICSVCHLRPQGPDKKAKDRKVCNVCEKRRLERSEDWSTRTFTTIWIDEVTDINGRLALVVAQFGIDDWLSGNAFNKMVAFDPKKDPSRTDDKGKTYDFDLSILIEKIKYGLENDQPFGSDLLGSLIQQRGGLNKVREYYEHYVAHTDLEVFSSKELKPELLALYIIRQFPSFARVRRVWETTQNFWEEITSSFKDKDIIGEVGPRIRVYQKDFTPVDSKDTLKISHAYEMKFSNTKLSIIYVKDGEFLVADNPQRAAVLLNASTDTQQDYSKASSYVQALLLKQRDFEIEEPTGYGPCKD